MNTLARFSMALEEGSDDTQIRVWALEKSHQGWPPTFKHGSGIILKPGIDLNELEPLPNPTFTLNCTGTDGVDIRSAKSLGMLRADDKELFARLDDPLYLKDLAYANHFMIINITKEIAEPVTVDINISDQVISHVVIKIHKDARASLVLTNRGGSKYTSRTIRIIQEPYSTLDIIEIEDYSTQTTSFNRLIADQDSNSKLNYTKLCFGSDYCGVSLIGKMQGEGSQLDATVLFAGSGQQKFDIYTEGHHQARHTKCNLITRGVLNGRSKALSRGLIKIDPDASGSEGYEKQDTLLLSCSAEADAIPNLEIGNHDVKCSHGSSIGQLDLDKVFYLMSRGMSEDEAKQQIVEGYFSAALSRLDGASKEAISKTLSSNLSRIFRK